MSQTHWDQKTTEDELERDCYNCGHEAKWHKRIYYPKGHSFGWKLTACHDKNCECAFYMDIIED